MTKITPEKTYSLLEKLAEYVMTEIPLIKEELNKKADKSEINELKIDVNELKIDVNELKIDVTELKEDVNNLKQKVDIIINGQDKQAKQLDDLKTEQVATNSALLRHEERITDLEQKVH